MHHCWGWALYFFQKDSKERSSILQAGSTSLKHAQIRWSMTELELLAFKYLLNKCNFYSAHSSKPIVIYSDCSGIKQFQLCDISDIDNKHMASIKCDIMHYNYQIKHIPGQVNCIADCMSRTPQWLVGKDRGSDSAQGPSDGDDCGPRDELCMRVITVAMHLLKDNPAISAIEEVGKKDPDYSMILDYIRTNRKVRELPTHSEGFRMGGEWPKIEVLPEAVVIVLRESNSVRKI